MPNRQQRRELQKQGLAFTPKQEALINEAIKRNYELGSNHGRNQTIKTCYAATCLAVKEVCGFSTEQVYDVLKAMDHNVVYSLSSEEDIDRVLDEVGIRITFSDPFSNIEEVGQNPSMEAAEELDADSSV